MSLTFTILGCGSSGGVPRLAQGWGACDPENARNRRRRCSALVEREAGGLRTRVLIDTSPDLREQLLGVGVERLDGVLMTHSHADHTHGIDDLRPLVIAMRRKIDVHMDEATSRVIRRAFDYLFEAPAGSLYPPLLNEARLTPGQPTSIDGPAGSIAATPFALDHGDIQALGFRIGALAYTPDLKAIPPESEPLLEGLDVWVIDGLRFKSHPTHFSIGDALEWIDRKRPRRAVITNMHNDVDYEDLSAQLPANVTPAYDGLRIEGF